jgi:hypothetical protein
VQPAGERAAQLGEDQLGGALRHLDRDVAGEAVRDDHVGHAGRDRVALDVADEVKRRVGGEGGVHRLDQRVTL